MRRILQIILVVLLLLVIVIAGLWAIGGRRYEYEFELSVNAPPERIYPYLTDPQLLPKWISGLVESKPVTKDGLHVGARSIETVEENARRITMESEVTRYEPNRVLESRLTNEMMDVLVIYELQPDGNGTRLRHKMSANYKGFFIRVIAPLIGGSVRSKLEGDLNRLKHLTESNQ